MLFLGMGTVGNCCTGHDLCWLQAPQCAVATLSLPYSCTRACNCVQQALYFDMRRLLQNDVWWAKCCAAASGSCILQRGNLGVTAAAQHGLSGKSIKLSCILQDHI
jgi:hypothetical protein